MNKYELLKKNFVFTSETQIEWGFSTALTTLFKSSKVAKIKK